ncbi:MAG: tRNA-dihydrouridine synthase family protein [Verrucomicrobiota bacterium]
MKGLFPDNRPLLALAPMQDVTDWAFWKLIAGYSGPDLYFTEYFRVTKGYRLQRAILRSITENPTGKPAIAQIIGNDVEWMVKCAQQLEEHPVAAVDLNLGCPAPVVYRKCAGGGLLRDPDRIDELLKELRAGISGRFSVKTRIGFSDPAEFDRLLDIFSSNGLDLLTVHGRTVSEKYGPHVHLDRIAHAVALMPCPVIANGNVGTVAEARKVWEMTGAKGLMIGRGAIRNPWIFQQIRDDFAGNTVAYPTGRDVLAYVEALYESACSDDVPERSQVQKMKKYMNFLGEGIGRSFLHDIRRASTKADFFHVCRKALDHPMPMALEAEHGI